MDTVGSLILAFVLTLVLVPPIKLVAQKLGFVSKIDFRRRELIPRPLLGGVAILAACLFTTGAFNLMPWSLVWPAVGLAVLGAVDDKLQINARLKLIFEIVCVGLWIALTPPENLLLVRTGMPVWPAMACHAFWVVGLINAFNMIDGLDGLASGMAMIGFAFLGYFLPNELRIFSWTICAGCAGHLYHNRPPASIYLGDSGSLVLGFLLSALGSRIEPHELHAASMLIPLFVLAHPEIDAILAMVRRKRAGTPLFQGDKDHLHHKLRRIGLGEHQALAVIYFASVYCGLTAILLDSMHAHSWTMALAAGLCIFGVSTILVGIYFIEYRLAAQFSQMGTPLLQKHIRIAEDHSWSTTERYQAVVFDLLPYFKEMQERGISPLSEFVNDFSAWINHSHANDHIIPAGSYSIIVLTRGTIDQESTLHSFSTIVSRHGLLKNAVGIPWGLQFYLDSTAQQVFERKFGLHLKAPVLQSKKAA